MLLCLENGIDILEESEGGGGLGWDMRCFLESGFSIGG